MKKTSLILIMPLLLTMLSACAPSAEELRISQELQFKKEKARKEKQRKAQVEKEIRRKENLKIANQYMDLDESTNVFEELPLLINQNNYLKGEFEPLDEFRNRQSKIQQQLFKKKYIFDVKDTKQAFYDTNTKNLYAFIRLKERVTNKGTRYFKPLFSISKEEETNFGKKLVKRTLQSELKLPTPIQKKFETNGKGYFLYQIKSDVNTAKIISKDLRTRIVAHFKFDNSKELSSNSSTNQHAYMIQSQFQKYSNNRVPVVLDYTYKMEIDMIIFYDFYTKKVYKVLT